MDKSTGKSVKCEILFVVIIVILKLVYTNVKKCNIVFKLSDLEKMKVAPTGACDPN